MLFASALFYAQFLIGQETSPIFYRQYASQKYMKELMVSHPEMVEARSAIERHTYDFLRYGLPDTPYIPVVFHFIGSASASITLDDVVVQLSMLNLAFNLPELPMDENYHPAWTAEHFDEKAAMPSIGFCLATQDPLGNPTTGILYVPSQTDSFMVGTAITTSEGGGSIGWEPKNYLNIYVAPLDGGVAGFAQMPGGPNGSDGIVINTAFFARKNQQAFVEANPSMSNYSLGRTLVHLVGTYLNLYELWNDDQPCTDDFVMDTPIHNAPNYDKPGYRHVSTCMDNPVEMTMNLMDNTDDEAQFMFTNGQMMRMYATLAPDGGPRAGLRTLSLQCGGGHLDIGSDGRSNNSNLVESTGKFEISVYPNPASDGFTVMITSPCEGETRLSMYSQLGVEQHAQTIDNASAGMTNSIYINAWDWSPGMYLLRAQCGSETASVKVLLEH